MEITHLSAMNQFMPKVTTSYYIEWSRSKQNACATIVFVSDANLFRKIAETGLVTSKPFAPEADYCIYSVQLDENDPIHGKVWQIFREHGIDLDSVPGFLPNRVRTYTEKELDCYQLFALRPTKGPYIANFDGPEDKPDVLMVDKLQNNKQEFSFIPQSRVFYASAPARDHLNAQNLIGLEWVDAVFDRPEKVIKPLFRLRSSVTMPKCLTRLIDDWGNDAGIPAAGYSGGRDWDNGGYRPPEMTFRRSEVAALGKFDVALSQEVVGLLAKWYRPEVIISQRFRQILSRMKHTTVGFNPVNLVE